MMTATTCYRGAGRWLGRWRKCSAAAATTAAAAVWSRYSCELTATDYIRAASSVIGRGVVPRVARSATNSVSDRRRYSERYHVMNVSPLNGRTLRDGKERFADVVAVCLGRKAINGRVRSVKRCRRLSSRLRYTTTINSSSNRRRSPAADTAKLSPSPLDHTSTLFSRQRSDVHSRHVDVAGVIGMWRHGTVGGYGGDDDAVDDASVDGRHGDGVPASESTSRCRWSNQSGASQLEPLQPNVSMSVIYIHLYSP